MEFLVTEEVLITRIVEKEFHVKTNTGVEITIRKYNKEDTVNGDSEYDNNIEIVDEDEVSKKLTEEEMEELDEFALNLSLN